MLNIIHNNVLKLNEITFTCEYKGNKINIHPKNVCKVTKTKSTILLTFKLLTAFLHKQINRLISLVISMSHCRYSLVD